MSTDVEYASDSAVPDDVAGIVEQVRARIASLHRGRSPNANKGVQVGRGVRIRRFVNEYLGRLYVIRPERFGFVGDRKQRRRQRRGEQETY